MPGSLLSNYVQSYNCGLLICEYIKTPGPVEVINVIIRLSEYLNFSVIDINRYLSYTLDSFLQQDYSPVSFISRFCASFMMVT